MCRDRSTTARPPITDSPWFWTLLFCSLALVATISVGPRFARRQAQLEQRAAARERIAFNQPPPAVPPRAADEPRSVGLGRLAPLAAVMAAGWIASWVLLRRDLRRSVES